MAQISPETHFTSRAQSKAVRVRVADYRSDLRDEDFQPDFEAPEEPSLSVLEESLRTRLLAGESYLLLIEELRLFIMARFYQMPPESIVKELVSWGLEFAYVRELVNSALATDRDHPKAKLARRMAEAADKNLPADPAFVAMTAQAPQTSPDPDGSDSPVPEICPMCNRVLYPVARFRPAPSLSWRARFVLLSSCVASAVLYFVMLVVIKSEVAISMWLLALICCPIAIVPALVIGMWAYKFQRVVRVRCTGCGWSQCFKLCQKHRDTSETQDIF
jgi:hypothetical protein